MLKHVWTQLGNFLFSTQRKRRVRASMTLQATALMAMCVVLLGWLASQGLAPAQPVVWWAVFSLGGMLVMYALVRSGATEKLRDPAMTFVQILLGVTSSGIAYVLTGEARGIVPVVLALTLLFAGLNLRQWQVSACVLYAVGVYALALLLASHYQPVENPMIALLHVGVLIVTLLGCWLLGLRMAALRQHLRRQQHDLQQALAINRELAAHDALTGLLNRRSLQELLNLEQQRALRSQRRLLVALVDLDHFKNVNDTFGHNVGDSVLQTFAQVAKNKLRATDVVGRWGGEEFMVLMVESDLPVAQEAMNRLREVLANTPMPCEPPIHVTCSIGLTRHVTGESIEDTIHRADKALYVAKSNGRNRVAVLHPDSVQPAHPPLAQWLEKL